jgi:AmiR/NasT family two-component response regulator
MQQLHPFCRSFLRPNFSLTEEEAYIALKRQNRRRRLPMKQLAEAIILSAEGWAFG